MKNSILILLCFYSSIIEAQRNLILIIADDLGTDYLGFYEDFKDTVAVPNIRKLVAKGVRFKNGMSNPVCSSTRAGILTGRYSFRTGVGNIVGGTGGSGVLSLSEMCIPKLLKNFNPTIRTANIGKWHLHNPTPTSNLLNPLTLGYDHFEGPFIGQLTSYINWTKYTDGVQSAVTTYATTENVNNALSWVKAQDPNKPFFLWLAFNAPHAPYHLPPANLHTYTGLSGTQQDIQRNPKPYFKASLQALDTEIGRLFDSLTVYNRMDSTDIIFIGDNGNTTQTAQITNLDKAKGTIYQYGVHVPFIVAGPSVLNPNRSSDALVNTADLFSTILELLGNTNWQSQISNTTPIDSKSLLPILKNQQTDVRDWSFCELFKLTPDSLDGKAIRNKDYKLLRFDYGTEEFYQLSNDILEENNLLKANLSTTDIANYNYLCDEMSRLVGTNNCSTIHTETIADKTTIDLFPNPFTDILMIPSENYPLEISIFNLYAQKQFSTTVLNAHPLELNFLQAGTYLLKIIDSKGNTKTAKVLKW